MRVLIIRPELQAARTAEKLSALGHEPVAFPLFRPAHNRMACLSALKSPHGALAVTSAEAVRCLQKLGPSLEPHLATPLFAVGKSTARMAREAGFSNIIQGEGNGQELALLIARSARGLLDRERPLLYLAGVKHYGAFEKTLQEKDIPFATAEVYDMVEIPYSIEEQRAQLVNKPVDAAFFFSRENARAFFGLDVFRQSKEALRKTLFFCLSRNIAEAVPEELKNSAVVSLNPDEDELIDLL